MSTFTEGPVTTGPDGTDPDDRSVRRTLLLFATSLIVVAIGGLVAVTFGRDGGGNRNGGTVEGGSAKSETGGPANDPIGPRPGEEIAAYAAARAQILATATGERAAVVSFGRYLTEGEARAAVGQARVTSLLVAAPGGTPADVAEPMPAWVESQVAASRAEREEIRRLLPTVDDPEFADFYRQELTRLTKVIDSIKPDDPLVFAAVVRAPVSALKGLATRPDVRLVDVGTRAEIQPGTMVVGLRPEEKDRANDPPNRPE